MNGVNLEEVCGMYRDYTGKRLYEVLGMGRNFKKPDRLILMVAQIKDDESDAPDGTVWMIDFDYFFGSVIHNKMIITRFTPVVRKNE